MLFAQAVPRNMGQKYLPATRASFAAHLMFSMAAACLLSSTYQYHASKR